MLKIIFKLNIRVHSLMDITGRIETRIDDSHAPSGIQYLILLYIILQSLQLQSLVTFILYNYMLINDVSTNRLIL